MTKLERTAILNQLAKAQTGKQLDELTSSIAEAYKPEREVDFYYNNTPIYKV